MSGVRDIAGPADIEDEDDPPAHPAATPATASDAAVRPTTKKRDDAGRGRGVVDMSVFTE